MTQQLARNFLLTAEPRWRRFYLDQRGSFAIHGFDELFGKDLPESTLPEAATLAGIIPAPNAYSPSKHPDVATVRRNLILRAMRHTGAITAQNYEKAKQAELEIILVKTDATDAPTLSISFAKNY